MENIIQNYAIHLDNIRIEYKMTQEKLCDGICSTRNYRRYLTGERVIPHEKIYQFCEKLGISATDFFYTYNRLFQVEFQKVYRLYTKIREKDYLAFYELLEKISKERLFNIQNRKFLEFCVEFAKYKNKKVHPKDTISRISEIIDYPNCISRDAYDFIDIISLNLISEIETQFNKTTALDRLIEILRNNKLRYLSSESNHIIPNIYGNVALMLGKLHRIEECKDICDKGLEFSLTYFDISNLTRLRYYRAISLLKLGYREEAEIESIRCIMTAVSEASASQYNHYYNLIQKDFSIDPLSLIPKYKNKFF